MAGVTGGRYRSKIIEWFTKKPFKDHTRNPNAQATRSIPAATMPNTENSALSANYYHQRDLRRMMGPPVSVLGRQLASGIKPEHPVAFNSPVPGNIYNPGETPYMGEVHIKDRIGAEKAGY